MKEIKAVGFDLDLTLYLQTPELQQAIQGYISDKASKLLGISSKEASEQYISTYQELQSGRRALIAMGIGNEELASSIVQKGLENADIASYLCQDEKLVNMLEEMVNWYNLFLITSSRKDLALSKLDALGIEHEIFYPRLYSDTEYIRNDGSAFKYVSKELGIPLDQIMFVGDRDKVDILPAKKLGMTTAIVNATSEEATHQLKEIYDLEKILDLRI